MGIDSIVDNKIKRCDKSATSDYVAITRDATTVEKANLISCRNRYTREHVDCNYRTHLWSHFTTTLSCLILSRFYRIRFIVFHAFYAATFRIYIAKDNFNYIAITLNFTLNLKISCIDIYVSLYRMKNCDIIIAICRNK